MQMKEIVILVGDPEIPGTVHGMHDPARHATYGNKPAVLEVGKRASRRDPNSPAIILEERVRIIRQSTASLAIDRNLPVIPSVQAITRSQPNAAVPGRQDRPNVGVG